MIICSSKGAYDYPLDPDDKYSVGYYLCKMINTYIPLTGSTFKKTFARVALTDNPDPDLSNRHVIFIGSRAAEQFGFYGANIAYTWHHTDDYVWSAMPSPILNGLLRTNPVQLAVGSIFLAELYAQFTGRRF
jgi:hypothetical protein